MKEILGNRPIRVYLRRREKRSNKVVYLRGYKGDQVEGFRIELFLLCGYFFFFCGCFWGDG